MLTMFGLLKLLAAWFICATITYSSKSEGISLQQHGRRLDDASGQAGFISIDCGAEANYMDESTTIPYTSDASYVDTGINMNISTKYMSGNLTRLLNNVRSFTEGTKNCYTLRPDQGNGTNYLVRAYFMYGNYDSLDKPPTFDLHLGVDVWDTVKLDNSSHFVMKEMIHTPSTDYLYVCLANIGSGTPFISGLELRHLTDDIYVRQSGWSLDLHSRGHVASTFLEKIRYQDDIFDRIWRPSIVLRGTLINTTSKVDSSNDGYKLPSSVMKAAVVPVNVTQPLLLSFTSTDESTPFYICLHFAELWRLRDNQYREFTITVNGQPFFGPFAPIYLSSFTIYTNRSNYGSPLVISIHSTKVSNLPPLLNAFEIFKIKKLSQLSTKQVEVDAVVNIKSMYNLTKNWQGDPCNPKAYSWVGIGCSYDNPSFSRITTMNLSSSRLTGDITASFGNLSSLQILDLSNNKLSGQIPEFLTELPLLTSLNLASNNFTGSVPELLLKRSRDGSLLLSVGNNPGLCSSGSCTLKKKRKAFIAPVAACAAVLVLLLAVSTSIWVYVRRKKLNAMQSQIQVQTAIEEPANSKRKGGLALFTYSEVTTMTRGFQRQLGKGGFGVVYYGCLKDGTEVAVKMLSPSIHASEQFSAEVELLMVIRHKNLVSLVGYCEEGTNLGLIYEYMACGNLQKFLLGTDAASESSSWKMRLQIAIDAAQGLDYLHNGCRPPIVHRDVKTPNILLNISLQAKMADFGLSKIFPDEIKSHVSTRVIGTPGYLDPEYHVTEQLNEKSDVYSFGVVLLELITGQEPIVKIGERERIGLVHWVSPMIERGDIWSIIDQRLKPVQNSNSVWRATDIALMCVKPTPVERPNMSHVVSELKECLAIEMKGQQLSMNPDDSMEMRPMIPSTGMAPAAR